MQVRILPPPHINEWAATVLHGPGIDYEIQCAPEARMDCRVKPGNDMSI
jgi:hypothetical protein